MGAKKFGVFCGQLHFAKEIALNHLHCCILALDQRVAMVVGFASACCRWKWVKSCGSQCIWHRNL